MNCVFCKIHKGELPASFVYKDSDVSALMDLYPINPGHVLVVPNSHYQFFEEIPSATLAKMMSVAQDVQRSFQNAGVKCEASNVFLSNGRQAGQEVPHAHFHIVPRFKGDGHRMGFSPADPEESPRSELDLISQRIGAVIKESAWMPPRLETNRLLLRPLEENDVDSIFEYCSDEEVARFTLWEPHKSKEDSLKLVQYALGNYKKEMTEPYGITLKSQPDKVIGTVGWFWASKTNSSIEIAYALSRQYWGRGLMVEACRGMLNDALQRYKINRVSARFVPGNSASQRVMEKLGMKYEGTFRQSSFVKGRFVDIIQYALIRDEWS